MLHRKIGWMLLCSAVLLASCNDDETNGNGGNGPAVPPAKVPFEATVELVLTAKEEVAEQAAYRVGLGSGVSYTTTDGQYKEATGASTMTIGKDKVEKYRQTILGRTYKSTERIEVSGK